MHHLTVVPVQLQLAHSLPLPAAKVAPRAGSPSLARSFSQDSFLQRAEDGVELESLPFVRSVPEQTMRLLTAQPPYYSPPITILSMRMKAAAPQIVF